MTRSLEPPKDDCKYLGVIRTAILNRGGTQDEWLAWVEAFAGESMTFPKLECARTKIVKLVKAGEFNKHKLARDVGCSRKYVQYVFKKMHLLSQNEQREKKCRAVFTSLGTAELYDQLKVVLADKRIFVHEKLYSRKAYVIFLYREGKGPRVIYDELKFMDECAITEHRKARKMGITLRQIQRTIHDYRVSLETEGFYNGRDYNVHKKKY